MLKHILSHILILLLLLAMPMVSGAEVQLKADQGSVSLEGELEIFPDAAGELTFTSALSASEKKLFQKIPGFVNRGFTREATWVHFSFNRTPEYPESFFLWLDPPFIDEATVYLQTGSDPRLASSYTRYDLGDHTPEAGKPLQHPSMVIPVQTEESNFSQNVFIRMRSNSTNNLKAWLLTPKGFSVRTSQLVLLQGGFVAIVLILALFNLILSLRLKDKVYGSYAAYLFMLFFHNLALEGMLTVIWPKGVHHLSDFFVGAGGVGLGFSTFALFCIILFNTSHNLPWFHRYLVLTLLLGIATSVVSVTQWYGAFARISYLNGLVLSSSLIILSVRVRRKNEAAANLFIIAFAAVILGAPITFLRSLGVLPVNWVTENAFQVGSLLHMVLMTLALSERVVVAEKKALKAALDAKQSAVILAEEMTHELSEKHAQLEESLEKERQARTSQSRFIDIISHEYRTPLAIIKTNIDLINLKDKATGNYKHLTVKMSRAVSRLLEIFEQTRDKESLDQHITLRFEQINLHRFIDDILKEFGQTHAELQIKFQSESIVPKFISGDAGLLKTVILNLLDNAIKYSVNDSPITVAVSSSEVDVTLTVQNRTKLVPELDLQKLAGKQYRGPDTGEIPGSGMGLYLSSSIIREHRGTLQFDTSIKNYFQVRITLPLVTDGKV